MLRAAHQAGSGRIVQRGCQVTCKDGSGTLLMDRIGYGTVVSGYNHLVCSVCFLCPVGKVNLL